MSNYQAVFSILLVSSVSLLFCDSFPTDFLKLENDGEIDAEYPVALCAEKSIEELKLSSNYSEDNCAVEIEDVNFWLAACSCYIDIRFPCPSCPSDIEFGAPTSKGLRSTSHINSPSHPPQQQSSTKPQPKHLPTNIKSSLIDEVDSTHAKIVQRNNTASTPANHFIRFG